MRNIFAVPGGPFSGPEPGNQGIFHSPLLDTGIFGDVMNVPQQQNNGILNASYAFDYGPGQGRPQIRHISAATPGTPEYEAYNAAMDSWNRERLQGADPYGNPYSANMVRGNDPNWSGPSGGLLSNDAASGQQGMAGVEPGPGLDIGGWLGLDGIDFGGFLGLDGGLSGGGQTGFGFGDGDFGSDGFAGADTAPL